MREDLACYVGWEILCRNRHLMTGNYDRTLAKSPPEQPCACRKSHPYRLSGMPVLVEDAAEAKSHACSSAVNHLA
jgi:hypothetical protein